MDDVLLEREAELSLLDDVLRTGAGGSGGLLVVRGAPGAGKTELLLRAVERATARGMTVLRARGSELEQRFAWGTAHGLFAGTPRELRDAAALALPVLGRVGGGAATVDSVPRPPAAEARFAVEHGLYWYVSDLADDAPVAIVVDDAQWADLASLSFLAHLADRLDGLPVTLVLAARATAGDEHEAILGHVERRPGAARCAPAPLSPAAVRELLARRLGEVAADALSGACHEQTRGNPFLTSELLAELRRTGVPATAEGARTVARLRPANVGRSVTARLATVDPRATTLARAVAILGRRTETWTAAAVAETSVEDATRLADELTTVGLLAAARPLEFVHPLVEGAVRDGIPDGQRALLHQRAVDVLVAGGAEPWMVAPHLVRTEPRGDAATTEVLRAAAVGAMDGGDPESAVALLRRAIRETWSGPSDPELLEGLGRALLATGDLEGLEHLRSARELAPVPGVRAALDLTIALTRYERGETREAQAAIASGLAEPLAADDPVRVSLSAADLTVRRSLTGGSAPGPDTARSALQALGGARTSLERLSLAQLAFHGLQTGDLPHEDVIALATRALAVPDALEPDRLDELVRPLAGMSLYFSDVCAPAEAAFTAAIDRSQRSGARLAWATAAFFRGASRFIRGDLPGAADDFGVALDAAEHGWAFALPSSRALRALVAVDRDEPELVEPLLELPGGDEPWRTHPTYPYVVSMRGIHLMTQGRAEEALATFLEAGALQEALGIRNPAPMHWQAEAVFAAQAAGREEQARALSAEVLDRARRYGAGRLVGIALRAAAVTTTGADAHALLTESETVLAASPARLEHAKTLLALGALERRMGRRIAARDTLRRALDQADRCGAPAVARVAQDELRVAGGRALRQRISGAGSLTSSERRVASLAAEGRTNREIAQALFVTLRTVEAHLTRTYAKLDVDRAGLATILADDGA